MSRVQIPPLTPPSPPGPIRAGAPGEKIPSAAVIRIGHLCYKYRQYLSLALLAASIVVARPLTADPRLSVALTLALGLAVTWSALFAAFYSPYPVGFWLTTVAFAVYLLSVARGALERGAR